ncbi:acyltransferase [Shewanella canadensis]|uniref:Acyltransferase n=1 Tax=Shewanella canadensis TaxID=271096 RepID=A0A3S0RTK3_9GAMM|nr:acyltransferase [Shewanella canadensis]RTR35964.1 acyltransferase [Shewanella canadensis]
MKKRFYCLPGVLVSFMMSLSPSFRFSNFILRMFNSEVEKNITIHSAVRFILPTRMKIGEGTTINAGSLIDSRCHVEIGKNCMIGRGSKLFSLGHDLDDDFFKSVGSKITLGDGVVVFPYVLIMPGVIIDDNAVILPGSVVTKSVPRNCVYGGVPAKFIRRRECNPSFSHNYNVYFGV